MTNNVQSHVKGCSTTTDTDDDGGSAALYTAILELLVRAVIIIDFLKQLSTIFSNTNLIKTLRPS